MNRLNGWLDHMVQRVCEWLYGNLPGQHGLATAGYRLAGMRRGLLLPVDRRLGPSVLHANYDPDTARLAPAGAMYLARKSQTKKGSNPRETDCGFWAYCHISGDLCQGCKPFNAPASVNALTPKAPKDLGDLCKVMGKDSGTFWWGCCTNPKTNEIRLIGFGDCCSSGSGPHPPCYPHPEKQCDNWTAAKNWCYSGSDEASAAKTYYCTVVVDNGPCTDP